MLTGKTKVYGVLADPVEHSLSPQLHETLSKLCGIDMVYVPLKTPVEKIGEALNGAYLMNFAGMNATIPHKVAVLPYLKGIDEDAKIIGAVNTLTRVEGGFYGSNTDVPGLARALSECGVSLTDRHVLLLGAGGAARAAATLAAKDGAADLTILNRSISRAEGLRQYLSDHFPAFSVRIGTLSDWKSLPRDDYFAIQTTSVGMWPKSDAAPIEDDAFYEKITGAFDCVYNPGTTKFVQKARDAGKPARGGLSMLLYQGILSFETWTGVRVSRENAEETGKVLEKEISRFFPE